MLHERLSRFKIFVKVTLRMRRNQKKKHILPQSTFSTSWLTHVAICIHLWLLFRRWSAINNHCANAEANVYNLLILLCSLSLNRTPKCCFYLIREISLTHSDYMNFFDLSVALSVPLFILVLKCVFTYHHYFFTRNQTHEQLYQRNLPASISV